MRAAFVPILAPSLALALAAPASGQDERTRIDDIAVADTTADNSRALDQVGIADAPLADDEQVRDRRIFVPQPDRGRNEPVVQLSGAGESPRPVQVAPAGHASAAIADVSNRAQSRPAGLQRIAGRDRCDPQLERSRLEECQRILERRSAEFNAPESPRLSAEERLLAEQSNDGPVAVAQGDLRLRYTSQGQPDADLRSNQELAAIVLDSPPPGTVPSAPAQPDVADLGDLLEGLSIQMQGAPPPGSN